MQRKEYLRRVNAITAGKRVGGYIYLHREALRSLDLVLHQWAQEIVAERWPQEEWNLVKLGMRAQRFSALHYPAFRDDPHPALHHSMSYVAETGKSSSRRYDGSLNPPILHRKEVFVLPSDADRTRFEGLTYAEEQAGLYGNTRRIGHKKNWQEALDAQQVKIVGHRVLRAHQASSKDSS